MATFDDSVIIRKSLTVVESLTMPAGSIGNAEIEAGAGILASKLQHQYQVGYAQASGTNATDEARVVHVSRGAGTIVSFNAGNVVAATGDATCAVDLKVNGVSVLSAPISLDSTSAAYSLVAGTVSSAAYTADDVIEITIDGTIGTGALAKGVFGALVVREASD